MLKKICLFLFSLVCYSHMVCAFPQLTGQVVDDANILSLEQKQQLTQTLQKANPHQVVAVSLNSLEGKEIEEYGVALGRHWGIGQKRINDGVLVLIAPNQRQMRIEVGYGLEGELTDAKCSQIINRIMIPLAKQGKYGEALIQGSEAVIKVLEGGAAEKIKEFSCSIWHVFVGIVIFWIIRFIVPDYLYNRLKKNKKEVKEKNFSEKQQQEIHKNRIKYVLSTVPFIFIYSIFVFVGVALLIGYVEADGAALEAFGSSEITALAILSFIFFHSLFFIKINFLTMLKEKYRFTDKEYQTQKKLRKGGLFVVGSSSKNRSCGDFSSSSSSWSSHSSGSSFHGGGGSFGGGGSSGRW